MADELNVALEQSSEQSGQCAEEEEGPKASARMITLNLVTGGFGLGIFSLPWSTAGASLFPGLVAIIAVVCLNGWTVCILIEGAHRYQAFDLGSLLSHLPPRISRKAQVITNVAVWIVLFVTQVGYVDVMASAVTSIAGSTVLRHRPLSVALVSLLIVPVCFLDQRYLNFTSSITVVVNLYIFVVMCFEPKRPAGVCYVGAGTGSVAMVAVMMQAVVIQMCVLPMYRELEDRSPERFRRVVGTGFGALIFIFCAFATVGYVVFGPTVKDNILDSLSHSPWGQAARVSAGLSMVGVFPIFEQAMVAPVLSLQTPHRRVLYAAATVGTCALTMLAAMKFDSIGILNVINGSICSIVFVAIVPGVVGLFLLGRQSRRWRAAMFTLIMLGFIAGVLGMVYTNNYQEELGEHCAWTA